MSDIEDGGLKAPHLESSLLQEIGERSTPQLYFFFFFFFCIILTLFEVNYLMLRF